MTFTKHPPRPGWNPIRHNIFDDTAVAGISISTGLDEFAVVGRLTWFWALAAQQSADGYLPNITSVWLDCRLKSEGFAEAMQRAGWLVIEDGGIRIPSFDVWLNNAAKKRLSEARKKQRQRDKCPENVPEGKDKERDKIGTNVPSEIRQNGDAKRDESKSKSNNSCMHVADSHQIAQVRADLSRLGLEDPYLSRACSSKPISLLLAAASLTKARSGTLQKPGAFLHEAIERPADYGFTQNAAGEWFSPVGRPDAWDYDASSAIARTREQLDAADAEAAKNLARPARTFAKGGAA